MLTNREIENIKKRFKNMYLDEETIADLEKNIETFMRHGNLCIRKSEIELFTEIFSYKGIKTKTRDLSPRSRRCVIIERLEKNVIFKKTKKKSNHPQRA